MTACDRDRGSIPRYFRGAAAAWLLLAHLTAVPAESWAIRSRLGWHRGARDWEEAVAEAGERRVPLFLYFRASWCGFCRTFETEYLDHREVEDLLDGFVPCEVEPEADPDDRDFAKRFGVTGYPTLMVLLPGSDKHARVYPFREGTGIPTGEFILQVKRATARVYVDRAYAGWASKQYERSLPWLNKALEWDQGNADAWVGLGVVAAAHARATGDPGEYRRAEEHFRKALQLNPAHGRAKSELEKLPSRGPAP